MTTRHGRMTLAALALLLFGCSVGVGRVAYARPHNANETGSIDHEVYHGNDIYIRSENVAYGVAYPPTGAFLKFDLPSLPSGATVNQAWVNYYQSTASSNLNTALTHLQSDPTTHGNGQVWSEIQGGMQIVDQALTAETGWVRRALNSNGIQVLQDCLAQGWLAVGIRALTEGGTAMGYFPDTAYAPFLEMPYWVRDETDVYPAFDQLLSYPLAAGETDSLRLFVRNASVFAAPHTELVASIDGVPFDSIRLDSIPPYGAVSIVFVTRTPDRPYALGRFGLVTRDSMDLTPSNDTALFETWIFPRGTYYAQTFDAAQFPPANWGRFNMDQGSRSWASFEGYANSGARRACCVGEPDRRNDDWLVFSSAIIPTTGWADSVGFYYRTYSSTVSESSEAWTLSGTTPPTKVSCLWASGLSESQYLPVVCGLDDFDDDTIRVGIRYNSLNGTGVNMDDFFLFRAPSGGVEAPTAASLPVSFSVVPNPARSGEAVSIRCATTEPGWVRVYDALGRSVWSITIARTQAAGTRPLILPRFAAGVYLVRLKSGSETATAKLVIQP